MPFLMEPGSKQDSRGFSGKKETHVPAEDQSGRNSRVQHPEGTLTSGSMEPRVGMSGPSLLRPENVPKSGAGACLEERAAAQHGVLCCPELTAPQGGACCLHAAGVSAGQAPEGRREPHCQPCTSRGLTRLQVVRWATGRSRVHGNSAFLLLDFCATCVFPLRHRSSAQGTHCIRLHWTRANLVLPEQPGAGAGPTCMEWPPFLLAGDPKPLSGASAPWSPLPLLGGALRTQVRLGSIRDMPRSTRGVGRGPGGRGAQRCWPRCGRTQNPDSGVGMERARREGSSA